MFIVYSLVVGNYQSGSFGVKVGIWVFGCLSYIYTAGYTIPGILSSPVWYWLNEKQKSRLIRGFTTWLEFEPPSVNWKTNYFVALVIVS